MKDSVFLRICESAADVGVAGVADCAHVGIVAVNTISDSSIKAQRFIFLAPGISAHFCRSDDGKSPEIVRLWPGVRKRICVQQGQKILHRGGGGKAEEKPRKMEAFTAEALRARRKPCQAAARFDETEPAAIRSMVTAKAKPTATATAKPTAKTLAQEEKAGGR